MYLPFVWAVLWTAIRCSMFLKHWDVIKLDMWSISMIHFKQEYYLGFSEKTFLHFYNFRKIYSFTDLHFPHCTKSVIMLGERHLNWMRFCSLSTFLTSKRHEVFDCPAKNYYFLFESNSLDFKWPSVNFQVFVGQIVAKYRYLG